MPAFRHPLVLLLKSFESRPSARVKNLNFFGRGRRSFRSFCLAFLGSRRGGGSAPASALHVRPLSSSCFSLSSGSISDELLFWARVHRSLSLCRPYSCSLPRSRKDPARLFCAPPRYLPPREGRVANRTACGSRLRLANGSASNRRHFVLLSNGSQQIPAAEEQKICPIFSPRRVAPHFAGRPRLGRPSPGPPMEALPVIRAAALVGSCAKTGRDLWGLELAHDFLRVKFNDCSRLPPPAFSVRGATLCAGRSSDTR